MTNQQSRAITLPTQDTDPAIILFGNDDSGKPHASTFNIDQRHDAIKAAGLMGFRALAVEGETLMALAARIPAGKVFGSGKGFVPFVKREVGEQLERLATARPDLLIPVTASVTNSASDLSAGSDVPETNGTTVDATPPKDWMDIKVGSRVLAVDDHEDGWWEAIVQHVHESGTEGHPMAMLTLKWEDFPDEKRFTRRFDHVALIHPDYPFAADGTGAA